MLLAVAELLDAELKPPVAISSNVSAIAKSMDEFALGSGFNGSSDGKLPSSSVGPISRTSSHSSNFLEGGDRYRDLNLASLDDPSLFFFG